MAELGHERHENKHVHADAWTQQVHEQESRAVMTWCWTMPGALKDTCIST